MNCFLAGIGTAVPPHRISQADAAEISKGFCCQTAQQHRLLPALFRRSGVESRHSVLLGSSNGSLRERQSFYADATSGDDRGPQTSQRMDRYEADAPALAARASQTALDSAGIAGERITHLVTVSCSGFSAPGVDVSLIKMLDLLPRVARTHIGYMGCHGALNGLRVARAFTQADPDACVLLCAVELCSLHYQYGWDPEQIVANALFADGAAAVVGVGRQSADAAAWRVAANGSTVIDDSEDMIEWRIGDHGFEMTLSPRVPDLIRQKLRPWLQSWLDENGLSIDQVGSWAVHPGGPRILGAFGDAAGLQRTTLAVSQSVLAEYGNMSSPTVLFIVDRLQRQNARRPCVALGFGPGLAVEAVLFR